MKKQIKDLLIRLQQSTSQTKKRKLRKRLRALGHQGGSCGKVIKVRMPKKLTPIERQRIAKHNKKVTRRIESGKYRPFS